MAQIKSKQIKLTAQGDLIVANASANGSNLTVGANEKVLVSNGTSPYWGEVTANGISLTEGDVFIGGSGDIAAEASATSQGEVVVAGAGPNYDFAVGFLAADYVTFTANTANNIAATDVQTALVEVANERPYIHTSSVDPSANNDGVDTAALGVRFKLGDMWLNTVTDNVWNAVDVSTGAAVWTRSVGVASSFVYKGDVDASNSGSLPSTPVAGDWWRVGTTGGTQNFNGTWDANGEPNGATFEVGDAIVYGDDGDWHKIDNTDPAVNDGNGITVSGGPSTYTVAADADEVTITASGGTGDELAVYGGTTTQVLRGQGASSDAAWGWLDDLRDSSGNLIVDGVGSGTPVNYLEIYSSDTGNDVQLVTAGSDTDIGLIITAKGAGRITLDGTQWPNAGVAAHSILAAQTANDLSAVTAPDGTGNQILIYDDSDNTIKWVTQSSTGNNIFATITGDTGSATADTVSDTLNIAGGEGITTTATDNPEVLTIDLNINELSVGTIDESADYLVFYDTSVGDHKKVLPSSIVVGGTADDDEAVATGGVNESFVSFFSNTPINDAAVTVFFNGLKLRATGWTRSGTTLTLVDSVNGYAAEAGDIISSHYHY